MKAWLKENEHDVETYDFDAEEEYDEAAEGGEEEEEDLLDEVAAEAVANANEEKESEEKNETEDKPEDAADTNEDVAEAEEATKKPTEQPAEENTDDREVEQTEEKTDEPKEDFEMVEQAEVDAANEAEAEVQDQAPSEQTNGTSDEAKDGEENPEEEKMVTTEGEGVEPEVEGTAGDEEFSDDSDMFKEAQKAKMNEENNQQAVPEADILELDYDDDTLIDKPAETNTAKEKPKPSPEKSEVDKMANVKFLWISGLNKDVKATEIREEFEKNELGERPLRSCKVAVSKKNGGSAFAFCEMGSAELADKIIALYHAKDMCGKIVQIKKEKFYYSYYHMHEILWKI